MQTIIISIYSNQCTLGVGYGCYLITLSFLLSQLLTQIMFCVILYDECEVYVC